ncbi:MAG: DUF2188 domain-containing protein [Candidatus Omnitrophota bacterium]
MSNYPAKEKSNSTVQMPKSPQNEKKLGMRTIIGLDKPTNLDAEAVSKAIDYCYEVRTLLVSYSDLHKWSIVKAGKMLKNFATKNEAVNYGRRLAKKNNYDLIIHRKDGKIIESIRHGLIPMRRAPK